MAAIARDLLGQLVEWSARLLVAAMQGFLVQSLVYQDVTPELVGAAAWAGFR